MIKYLTSLFLLKLILTSSLCITVLSNITTASGLGSSPALYPAGIGSSLASQKELANSTSVFKVTDEIKDRVNTLLDSNRTNAAIVIGIVDPNGTQFYSNGKMPKADNSTINENTNYK
jgi:hypothetical protein